MKNLLNLFKILSDDNRLRILMLLSEEDLCVTELCTTLELSQPKVSKHLGRLRDMGLVKDLRLEQFVVYSITSESRELEIILEMLSQRIDKHQTLAKDRERLKRREKYISQIAMKGMY